MAAKKPTPPETGKPDPDAPAPGAGDPPADPPAPDPAAGAAPGADTPPADPPPPKDESKNKPGGNGYVCIEPVKRNGKYHAPEDPIELSEADAKPLLDLQAIRKA